MHDDRPDTVLNFYGDHNPDVHMFWGPLMCYREKLEGLCEGIHIQPEVAPGGTALIIEPSVGK